MEAKIFMVSFVMFCQFQLLSGCSFDWSIHGTHPHRFSNQTQRDLADIYEQFSRMKEQMLKSFFDEDIFESFENFENFEGFSSNALYDIEWIEDGKGRSLEITPKSPHIHLSFEILGHNMIKISAEQRDQGAISSSQSSMSLPADIDPLNFNSRTEKKGEREVLIVSFPFTTERLQQKHAQGKKSSEQQMIPIPNKPPQTSEKGEKTYPLLAPRAGDEVI